MRAILNNALDELIALVAHHGKENIKSITMTRSELRECLSDSRASQYFPAQVNNKEARIKQLNRKLETISKLLGGKTLSEEEKQKLYDDRDTLELEISKLNAALPSAAVTFCGLPINITLR